MSVPDIASLSIHDPGPPNDSQSSPLIPDDIRLPDDRYLKKLKIYAQALPYSIESNSRMLEMLDFILLRIVQCVEAKDYDVALLQWDSMLS